MIRKQDIKDKFKNGDIPTGTNFSELIDFAESVVVTDSGVVVDGKQLKIHCFDFPAESYVAEDGLIGSFDELEKVVSFNAYVYDFGENGYVGPHNVTVINISNDSFSARVYELQTMGIGYTNAVGVKVSILGY